jgi:hypothetical protein
MNENTRLQLKKEFKHDVCDKHAEVDPDNECHWNEIAYGYFLAKGCTLEDASELSQQVEYEDDYFIEDSIEVVCTKCSATAAADGEEVTQAFNNILECPLCKSIMRPLIPLSEDRKKIAELEKVEKEMFGKIENVRHDAGLEEFVKRNTS